MTRLTESAIEEFAIKLFACLGVDCIHARMATDCSQLKCILLMAWTEVSRDEKDAPQYIANPQ